MSYANFQGLSKLDFDSILKAIANAADSLDKIPVIAEFLS
jgi:hypothetical protein